VRRVQVVPAFLEHHVELLHVLLGDIRAARAAAHFPGRACHRGAAEQARDMGLRARMPFIEQFVREILLHGVAEQHGSFIGAQ
jgi:hypothetical protein